MPCRPAIGSTLGLALLFTAGCAGTAVTPALAPHPADVFVGCYSQGNVDQVDLQVSGSDGSYSVGKPGSSVTNGDALTLVALTEQEWTDIPEEMAGQLETLIRDDIGLILLMKFRPDAVISGQVPESPYYLVAPRVGGALRSVECLAD